jgi:hypothetical protein
MEAPVYGPLISYSRPVNAPFQLNVNTASLEELKSAPAAWAIILKHAPKFDTLVNSLDVKPYLSTMTIDSFIAFGEISRDQVDAINTDLVRLPISEWPKV